MSAVLAPDQRTRLVKLLGMLGSAHAGERAAAAAKCAEIIATHQLTWGDLLQPPPLPAVVVDSGPRTWRVVAEEVLVGHYGALFAPREVDFLTGLLEHGFAPTPKQASWLAKIARRCGVPPWESVA